MSSNCLVNSHDPSYPADSISNTSYTDKTCFYTPYNQSVISKSNVSQEKSRYQSQDPLKNKLTTDILKRVSKTENLSQIIQLNLDGNSRLLKHRLKLISGLHNLMNLKELNLSNNDIEKIENLNNLKNLHILNFSFNKISKLENISALKQLEILNLSNNLIEEIPPIILKNVNLMELNLANNLISTKQSINNLKTLSKLTILNFSANPICDLPGYPNFVIHSLKKLLSLDTKMTPSCAKSHNNGQQASHNSSQINCGSVQSSTSRTHRVLPNQPAIIITPAQSHNNVALSYEQRLTITQNRLNELNLLSNRQELINPEDDNNFDDCVDSARGATLDEINDEDNKFDGNARRVIISIPEIETFKVKQENENGNSEQAKTGRFQSKTGSRRSLTAESIEKHFLKEKSVVDIYSNSYNQNNIYYPVESTQCANNPERKRQQGTIGSIVHVSGSNLNLDVNENNLYSFSGTGCNGSLRLDPPTEALANIKDVDEDSQNNSDYQKPTFSLKNRQIDERSTQVNESKISSDHLQKNYSSQNSSNLNSNQRYYATDEAGSRNTDLLQAVSGFSSPKVDYGFKNIYRHPTHYKVESFKVVNQENDRTKPEEITISNTNYNSNEEYSTVKKEPRDTLSFGNFPGTAEKEKVPREAAEINGKIRGLQIEIEQKLFNYDNVANVINAKKKKVLDVVISLDEVLQNVILQTGKINFRDDRIGPLNERSEILSRMRDFLDLMDYHTEQHINYFLILNQMGLTLESKENPEDRVPLDPTEIEKVDSNFESLSQQIDQIFNKLEIVNLQIFNIKNRIDSATKSLRDSQSSSDSRTLNEKLDLGFDDLYHKFDDLINNDVVRIKLFMELKVLYLSAWKFTKDLTHLQTGYLNFNLDTQPLAKKSYSSLHLDFVHETEAINNKHIEDHPTNTGESSMVEYPQKYPEDLDKKAARGINRATNMVDKENNYVSKSGNNAYLSAKENTSRDSKFPEVMYSNLAFAQKNTSSASKELNDNTLHREKFVLKERNNDFVFQRSTENDEIDSPKHISGQKNSSQCLSSESHSKVKNQSTDLRASLRSGIEDTYRAEISRRDGFENICQYCIVKDNTVKITQEEMMKAHRDRATFEVEAEHLRNDLSRVQKEAEENITNLKAEIFERAVLQDQERDHFSKALLLLSDISNKNSLKLDEIRVKINSASETHYPSPTNPFQWLVSMQTSTIEDLLKANRELQEKVGVFITDFHGTLNIRAHSAASQRSSYANVSKGVQVSNLDRSRVIEYQQGSEPYDQRDNISQKSFPSQIEVDTATMQDSNKGYFDRLLNQRVDLSQNQLSGIHQSHEFYVKQDANYTWNTLDDQPLHKSLSHFEGRELAESRFDENNTNDVNHLGAERVEAQQNQGNEFRSSNTDQKQSHQHQFSLNITNPDNEIQRERITLGQLTFHKNDIQTSGVNSNTNLNQILFGNSSVDVTQTSKKTSEVLIDSEAPLLLTETEPNENYRDESKEHLPAMAGTYSPFRHMRSFQVARINGSMLSNLQENIAQHLRENDKLQANKHLKKISNNIYQYKGLRDKLNDRAGRKTSKSSSIITQKSKIGNTLTPSRSAKLSLSPMVSNRRSTLIEKNYNDNSKGFASVRSTVEYNRPQVDSSKIFRKPACYRSTNERDVNVDLNQLLSGKKRVLESREITNYHEKFDLYSPYHPVHTSLGLEVPRASSNVLSIQVNNVGKSSPLMRSVERSLNW